MANFETTNYQELIDSLDTEAPEWVDSRLEIIQFNADTIRIDADYVGLMLTDRDGDFKWYSDDNLWQGTLTVDSFDPADVAKDFWSQVDAQVEAIINQYIGENK